VTISRLRRGSTGSTDSSAGRQARPTGETAEHTEKFFNEAKPREAREPLLRDAIATLEKLSVEVTKNFARLEAPRFAPKPDQFEDDSFELRETKEARRRNATPKPEPQKIDVLAATFTVNRAAKRMRNASQAHYVGRRHGLAGHNRRRKEELYELKDRGIAACVVAGRLKWIGTHGGLAV